MRSPAGEISQFVMKIDDHNKMRIKIKTKSL